MDKTPSLGAQSPSSIKKDIAAQNIQVIAQFPGLGSRLISTASSWLGSKTQPGDSMARVVAAKDHALSRPHAMRWALQVGYEYAGYKEDVSAINQSIALTFLTVFGDLTPLPQGERKGDDADLRKRQMIDYENALNGLRNLCLVYGQRYAKDASQQNEIQQLLSTYASQYRTFCSLKGRSGRDLEGDTQAEMHRIRAMIYPGVETPQVRPGSAPEWIALEGELQQRALSALRGMHTAEEREAGKAEKEPFAFHDGLKIWLHPQVMIDILRTPMMIEGKPIEGEELADKLEHLRATLQERFGPEYQEALADIVQILTSQTFSGFATTKAFEKYAVQEGARHWDLRMKKGSSLCSLTQEGQDLMFMKQVSFNKVDRNQDEPEVHSIVQVDFKIRIPKAKFFENRLTTDDLSDVHMTYCLTESIA